ncbi:MAG: hypothetical protein Q9211_006682 [Gyalolechia sp. 1 TL-2023]
MSLNPIISDHPDTSQQANPGPVDHEGTIIEWLRREAALERSFPYLKRKPSDTYPFRKPNYCSSTSSTSELDRKDDEVEDCDLPEKELYTTMAPNAAGDGDDHSTMSKDPVGDPSATPLTSAATPTPSQPAAPKIPTDPQWVTARLEGYRLYQEDREAFAKYPQFQATVQNILNRKRKSLVDPVDFSEFQLAWDRYKDKNEDTVLNKLLPFFMKEKRTVSVEGPFEEEDAHAVVSFMRSGLMEITNREFQRTCSPLREDGSPFDKKLLDAMAKEDGMTNPKPDRTFGIFIRKDLFPVGFSTPPEVAVWLEVMRGVHHPFFIVEGKSYQGNLLDAQNEACRGGATLVGSARRLLSTLGEPDIVGPDTRTFVFSATLSPGLMDIWVHWALVPVPGALPLYHMNKLMSKAIDDEENFSHLRKSLHNILDWGCGPRLTDLQPLYPSIIKYTERQRSEAKEKALATKAETKRSREEKASNKRPRLASAGQGP